MRRVVATGMGVVSPLGTGRERFWRRLVAGETGVGEARRFEFPDGLVRRAYPVSDLEDVEGLDPFISYAREAAREAVRDARVDLAGTEPSRIGLAMSSSKGGMVTAERLAERRPEPPMASQFGELAPDAANQWLAREFGAEGPTRCIPMACATGTASLMEGWRMVATGEVDLAIAGASDASITPLLVAGYQRMGVISQDGVRPFDCSRSGFLLGEGAAAVVFEALAAVRADGRRAYAEVLGGAYGQDGAHVVHFREENHTLERTLSQLFARCDAAPQDVDYVNAHATGTVTGDRYEAREYRRFFGRAIDRVTFGSTKGATGHLLGASGALQGVAILLAMHENVIPPTANLERLDPDCELPGVSARAQACQLRTALSVSLGFGGHAACILFRKL